MQLTSPPLVPVTPLPSTDHVREKGRFFGLVLNIPAVRVTGQDGWVELYNQPRSTNATDVMARQIFNGPSCVIVASLQDDDKRGDGTSST